jgi:hypothetical protein
MADAASPEPGAAAEKKRPLLRRVPTSLIVTVVGIALTAWLLPAFTRQWDDRQKAHEVKAALLEDMASASARALLGGDAYWSGRRVDQERVADTWSRASLEMEARLRIYFAQNVVTEWQLYSWFVDRWDNGHHIAAKVDLVSAWKSGFSRLDPHVAKVIKNLFLINDSTGNTGASFHSSRHSIERPPLRTLRAGLGIHRDRWYLSPYPPSAAAEEAMLFRFEQAMGREVVNGHMAGYSTSTHDLVHDLIP